jgi:predicted DNA-binding protein (UPF0251 family)
MSEHRYDVDAIRERMAEADCERLQRSRAGAERRRSRRRRSPARSSLDPLQRRQMARIIRETYQSAHAPAPGSLRDRRLRAALSLRELAVVALVSYETIRRAEIAAEAGDRSAISGPTWRSIAHALEKKTGRRVRLDDIRPPAKDTADA